MKLKRCNPCKHYNLHRFKDGVSDTDLVIEAATENLDIKLKIFEDLDNICKAETILATNTSSISITQIGAATKRPEKVIECIS